MAKQSRPKKFVYYPPPPPPQQAPASRPKQFKYYPPPPPPQQTSLRLEHIAAIVIFGTVACLLVGYTVLWVGKENDADIADRDALQKEVDEHREALIVKQSELTSVWGRMATAQSMSEREKADLIAQGNEIIAQYHTELDKMAAAYQQIQQHGRQCIDTMQMQHTQEIQQKQNECSQHIAQLHADYTNELKRVMGVYDTYIPMLQQQIMDAAFFHTNNAFDGLNKPDLREIDANMIFSFQKMVPRVFHNYQDIQWTAYIDSKGPRIFVASNLPAVYEVCWDLLKADKVQEQRWGVFAVPYVRDTMENICYLLDNVIESGTDYGAWLQEGMGREYNSDAWVMRGGAFSIYRKACAWYAATSILRYLRVLGMDPKANNINPLVVNALMFADRSAQASLDTVIPTSIDIINQYVTNLIAQTSANHHGQITDTYNKLKHFIQWQMYAFNHVDDGFPPSAPEKALPQILAG